MITERQLREWEARTELAERVHLVGPSEKYLMLAIAEIRALRAAWKTTQEKHSCTAPTLEDGICTCGLLDRQRAARRILDGGEG